MSLWTSIARESALSSLSRCSLGNISILSFVALPVCVLEFSSDFTLPLKNAISATSREQRTRKDQNDFLQPLNEKKCTVCANRLRYTRRSFKTLQLTCGHPCHTSCYDEQARENKLPRKDDFLICLVCNARIVLDYRTGGPQWHGIEKFNQMVKDYPMVENHQR